MTVGGAEALVVGVAGRFVSISICVCICVCVSNCVICVGICNYVL